MPWGFVWLPALGDELVDGALQPATVDGAYDLKPFTKDGLEALNGSIWRDRNLITDEAYKAHVTEKVELLMGKKAGGASKAGGGGGGASKAGGDGGVGASAEATLG